MALQSSKLAAFEHLAHQVLNLELVLLSSTLTPQNQINHSLFPKAVEMSYDELFFGGALLSCQEDKLYLFTERFFTQFLVVPLREEKGYLLLGPYLSEEDPVQDSLEAVLAHNNLPLSLTQDFISFYQQVPIISQDTLWSLVHCLILSVYERELSLESIVPVDYKRPEQTGASPLPVFEQDKLLAQADMLEMRYQAENAFLHQVTLGNYEQAIGAINFSINLVRTPHKLRNDKNLLIVLNTLLRKAVEKAHIHPLYLDRISSEMAVEIEQLSPFDSITSFRYRMVKEYCNVVNRFALAEYSPHVRRALQFITIHSSEACSLDTIAKALELSPNYLSAQFNKEVGQSIPQYLANVRIQEGAGLLLTSSLPVEKISQLVGYNDPNYFARQFKQHTGHSPSEYRKRG